MADPVTAPSASRPDLPTGTVTFLFTDIEGSTRLLQALGPAYAELLATHHRVLRHAIASHHGREVDTQGDSFFVAFERAADAIACAIDAQRDLAATAWPADGGVRVRMGIHAGDALVASTGYVGIAVHRAARIMHAGHGGQVLLSAAAASLVADDLPDGARLVDLGAHRLKDFDQPVKLYCLAHPDLDADFPPLVTLDRRPNNMPADVSSFVGRQAELASLDALLSSDGVRLVTLIGPGGTGKTRLAIRAASDQLDHVRDGAFVVDLAAAEDRESLIAAVAGVLGVAGSRDQPLVEAVKRHVGDAQLLLVLDNFEQVTVAAPVVTELLQACPQLRILVTSREALRVRGEQLVRVEPLALPAPDPRVESASLLGFEAIQLFVERARAVRPDFALTDDNARAVIEICRRLDGLPLAIELVTARLALFSPEALLGRLESRLGGTGRGQRDLPERHQTLRSTVDWSYRLLEPGEQALFAVLSLFAPARLDAVEATTGRIDGWSRTGTDPVDGIASLLEKSLVRRSGEDAVAMLETIREFAAERLAADPELHRAARRGHAEASTEAARAHAARASRVAGDPAVAALVADVENLEAAWRYWLEIDAADELSALWDALGLVYETTGRYSAMVAATDALLGVLERTTAGEELAARALTLRMRRARTILALHGYKQEAETAYAEVLEALEGQADQAHTYPILRDVVRFYMMSGRVEMALTTSAALLSLGEETGDPAILLDGHLMVGQGRMASGDLAGALEHFEMAIAASAATGYRPRSSSFGTDPRVSARTTSAFLLWLVGRPDSAAARIRDAIDVATGIGPFSLAYANFHAAFLHLWRLEPDVVTERARTAVVLAEQHGFPVWRALGTALGGAALVFFGETDDGLARVEAGVGAFRAMQKPPIFWAALRFVEAGSLAFAGRVAEATTVIDDVMAQNRDRSFDPSLCLLRGDIALGSGDPAAAGEWYGRALAEATETGGLMVELQAETRLTALRRAAGTADAGERLRAVYDRFSEGFATRDLVLARAVLDDPTSLGPLAR